MKKEKDKRVDQMSLFVAGGTAPPTAESSSEPSEVMQPETKESPAKKNRAAPPATRSPRTTATRKSGRGPAPPPPRSSPGGAPAGDVRLTVNIREDLHLKLKIAAAKGRTTIGELLEGLVEQHLR